MIFGSLIGGFIIAVIALQNDIHRLKREKSELIKMQNREIFDILDSMFNDELDEAEVQKFGNINELFAYLYDEYTTKEDLINDMTEDMKRQIVHNHYDERIVENNGEYFYSTEFGGINFDEPDSEMIITQ